MKTETKAKLQNLHQAACRAVRDQDGIEHVKYIRKLADDILRDEAEADSVTVMTPEEVALLRAGMVINAIKAVRARTGMGLVESKNLAEAAGNVLGLRTSGTWDVFKTF